MTVEVVNCVVCRVHCHVFMRGMERYGDDAAAVAEAMLVTITAAISDSTSPHSDV